MQIMPMQHITENIVTIGPVVLSLRVLSCPVNVLSVRIVHAMDFCLVHCTSLMMVLNNNNRKPNKTKTPQYVSMHTPCQATISPSPT